MTTLIIIACSIVFPLCLLSFLLIYSYRAKRRKIEKDELKKIKERVPYLQSLIN